MTQAVLPYLRAQDSGHIIMLSSLLGLASFPSTGIYSASKAAIAGLVDSLAQEVAAFGIKVSVIEPGPFISACMMAATSASTSMPGMFWRSTVSRVRTPWMVRRRDVTSMPWRHAQAPQIRSVDRTELRRVPSMSKRNAGIEHLVLDVARGAELAPSRMAGGVPA
ncbi:SDR family NAD(P)-dependent oxidoreductase [Ralstonia solanacearum]|uniref:Uncharacterized protein n=1 Tax=Ralstonia solanacearum CFBP2957 TaxID=859656 RepID=D8P3C8_RALSL|nr:SDR family NAD(P)-dependent oxidoreductase [Ralstonia solanacearum]CBJ53414.1 protein of unknown function [Ralstonia solanacearum CFBP2957]